MVQLSLLQRLNRQRRRLRIARLSAIQQLIDRHQTEYRALLSRAYREMAK